MNKTNVSTKSSELISVLNTHFKGKINLARVKLIALFVCSLCKVQTVTFNRLATAFGTYAKTDSSLRRIQRFIAKFTIDGDFIAKFSLDYFQKKIS